MSFARTNLVAALTIVVGMAIGSGLTFTLFGPRSHDVPSANPIATPSMTSEVRADAIDRAERILRTRIDEFGVEEPIIQKVGCCRLIVELPGPQATPRIQEVVESARDLLEEIRRLPERDRMERYENIIIF